MFNKTVAAFTKSSAKVKLYCGELVSDKYVPVDCSHGHVVNAVMRKTKSRVLPFIHEPFKEH